MIEGKSELENLQVSWETVFNWVISLAAYKTDG